MIVTVRVKRKRKCHSCYAEIVPGERCITYGREANNICRKCFLELFKELILGIKIRR